MIKSYKNNRRAKTRTSSTMLYPINRIKLILGLKNRRILSFTWYN